MSIAWLDCSVGVAGDMLLAALLDAGARESALREGLAGLGLADWELVLEHTSRGGLRALRASFIVGGSEADTPAPPSHHPHRPWPVVRTCIAEAALPPRVIARALAAYERLAAAEALLHGQDIEEVELHEVGSTDAILDVVGVCLALEDLGIDSLVAGALPMGEGRVRAAHGLLPLPAPATLQVLLGWPLVPAAAPGEWVTPTGAALVATLATPGPLPAMVPRSVGHGAGRRDPAEVANLVRVLVGEPLAQPVADGVTELACNVDDLPGELVPSLIERLLEAGALDAWAAPIHMKKGRPGLIVSALALPERADAVSDAMLRHGSTFGVRRHATSRRVLERHFETADTPYGPVRMKIGTRDGGIWQAAPEFEDVATRAREADVPLAEVHAAAITSWRLAQEKP